MECVRLVFECVYSSSTTHYNLQSNTRVKLIDLSANAITADGVWVMAQKGLIKNSTLEQLNISDNRIQDSGARALALAFESNKSIELLNITGNGIADEGVSVLMQVFFVFNLNSFRLRSCCAGTPHRCCCRRVLAARQVQLEVFIYGNEYRAAGRKAIAEAKAQNPLLTVYE